ncbi:MAG: alpha/beta hydrolase [Fuerstiella sp.]
MNILIPGLGGSSETHWQSLWELQRPESFLRVSQEDWNKPDCTVWVDKIQTVLESLPLEQLVLIGHSVGCAAVVHWLQKYRHAIKGVLLVAPSDVERADYPTYITGFVPLPLSKLACPGIVVASSNDHVVDPILARYFAECWGCEYVEVQNAGHFEPSAGFGEWPFGLTLLDRLIQTASDD